MYLDEIVAAQKQGEARGITSVCSAHPQVIEQTLRVFAKHPRNERKGTKTLEVSPLMEATCNQVNQYGGYTGMTPKDFVAYVRGIAEENNLPFENIILGGDHLGPNVWQNEPAESAMQKAEILIRDYVQAGFTKIHLDCSMKLSDDPAGALNVEMIAKRAARLAKIAENLAKAAVKGVKPSQGLRYVIGTEIPSPGGATSHEEGVSVTKVEDVRQTIEMTRDAFYCEGLQSAWDRVIAVVVQPGVEFGDDFVLPYRPEAARELSQFMEGQPLIYEAHSTDYQSRDALKNLVRDHFGILKVGPGLTFAFREAIFLLAMIEDELFPVAARSNIVHVLDDVMVKHPEYWKKYYQGDAKGQAFKRKFSLSDRIRYYWVQPEVQQALEKLKKNLDGKQIPNALLSQYVSFEIDITSVFEGVIAAKISKVLGDYLSACGYESAS